jgi:PAS domain S-box-containing protein
LEFHIVTTRSSGERYRVYFERALDGIHVLDIDGNVIEANQSFCEMLGYTGDELARMNVADWDAQWNSEQLRKKIRQLLRGREVFETRHRTKDGRIIDVSISVVAAEVDGQMAFFCSARDISAGKRSYAALLEAESRFRCVVEQTVAGAFIIQGDKFAYVNPRLAEIFGYPDADELTGRAVMALVVPEDRRMVRKQLFGKATARNRRIRTEFKAARRDGTVTYVGMEGAVSEYRGQAAIVGLMQDISARHEADRQKLSYIHDLELAAEGTVSVASRMGELRDPYTAGHERRVARLAAAIGGDLGLPEARIKGLTISGLLHDIGKIAVPAEILSKPNRLNDVEYSLMKMHAQHGYDVLAPVELPWTIANPVLQHHERLDGSGYPNGLEGDEITLDARILAVADTVEAMASHRPYRPGLGIARALQEIERNSGTLFDARVAESCVRLFRENAPGLIDEIP